MGGVHRKQGGSLDIAKAFDQVWHKALISKHPAYGSPEKLCEWVHSFFTGRSIKVVVDGSCSDLKPVNAGVPQGCVLFLLYINGMLHTSGIHCYADGSTGDASYSGHARFSRAHVDECRKELVSVIENTLDHGVELG